MELHCGIVFVGKCQARTSGTGGDDSLLAYFRPQGYVALLVCKKKYKYSHEMHVNCELLSNPRRIGMNRNRELFSQVGSDKNNTDYSIRDSRFTTHNSTSRTI
jgi:hypothetical protein